MANVDPNRRQTLFRRILVPSLLVLSLGMAALALLQRLHTRAFIKETLTSESAQVMVATDSALHYLMLQADDEGLQTTLDRLAAGQDIRRAYLLKVSGEVYRSSGKAAGDPIPSNVLEEARRAALHVSEETDGDREYLRSLKPIVAEQSCLGCHPGVRNGDPVGYIGIERWMDASTAHAQSMQVWAVAIDVLILVAMGVVLAFLIRRVTTPIQSMTVTTQRLAAGDLDSHLTYTAQDEIGDLADAVRSLAGYLRALCRLAEALSRGDLTVELAARSADDVLTERLNQARTSLGGVIREIDEVARAAAQGDLSRRGNHQAFQGAFRQMIQGVNTTLDAVLDPIHEATRVLERVAQRDLTARVRGDYQGDHGRVKLAVNQAVENLEDSLQQVAVSASQVAAASGQISSGSQSLAQGSSQQASTLQEVASSLQEVASMAASNASFAQEAQTLSVQARESSSSGMKNMEKLSEAIRKIKASADETAKIVRTIDEIAFQTNLLALNAAVEAARAGEAGKGFAVVAGEVRNLAIRCAEAAKSTALLIEGSVKNSEEGVKINSQVLQDLEQITQQVERVSQGMQEIATASEQQRLGIEQVAEAVSQMGQLTQATAANAEESAGAAEELSGQAEELTRLVGGFQLSVREGSLEATAKAQAAPPPPGPTRTKPNGKDKTSRRPARNLILDDSEGRLSQF